MARRKIRVRPRKARARHIPHPTKTRAKTILSHQSTNINPNTLAVYAAVLLMAIMLFSVGYVGLTGLQVSVTPTSPPSTSPAPSASPTPSSESPAPSASTSEPVTTTEETTTPTTEEPTTITPTKAEEETGITTTTGEPTTKEPTTTTEQAKQEIKEISPQLEESIKTIVTTNIAPSESAARDDARMILTNAFTHQQINAKELNSDTIIKVEPEKITINNRISVPSTVDIKAKLGNNKPVIVHSDGEEVSLNDGGLFVKVPKAVIKDNKLYVGNGESPVKFSANALVNYFKIVPTQMNLITDGNKPVYQITGYTYTRVFGIPFTLKKEMTIDANTGKIIKEKGRWVMSFNQPEETGNPIKEIKY